MNTFIDMSTILGIIIGIIATIIVGQYYFRRTVNKSIAIYLTLSSRIFAGIETEDRTKMKFYFGDLEVRELSQVEFIIANDGERAIRDCIEPLSLKLPSNVAILDATVLYQKPEKLVVNIEQNKISTGNSTLKFNFPLLNKGEFFLVKLLLNGNINFANLEFQILTDDLSRSIKPKRLPLTSTKHTKPRIEWTGIAAGVFFLFLFLPQAFGMYLLYNINPKLFSFPWTSFDSDFIISSAIFLWFFELIITFLFTLIAFIGMGFEEFYQRHPRFPLPLELRRRSLPLIIHEIMEQNELGKMDIRKMLDNDEKENPKS